MIEVAAEIGLELALQYAVEDPADTVVDIAVEVAADTAAGVVVDIVVDIVAGTAAVDSLVVGRETAVGTGLDMAAGKGHETGHTLALRESVRASGDYGDATSSTVTGDDERERT